MSDLLKPCPHCGSCAKVYLAQNYLWFVFCTNKFCNNITIYFETKERAINQWNTRAPQSEWISVNDDLPELHVPVLFAVKGEIRIGHFYHHNKKFISEGDKFYMSDVDGWMPLPNPPEVNE